jgi:hypothetical protein
MDLLWIDIDIEMIIEVVHLVVHFIVIWIEIEIESVGLEEDILLMMKIGQGE